MSSIRVSIMRLIAPALLASLAAATQAQSRPKVSALLSSGVVKFGATAQLNVEVEGARSARILAVPEVDGLKISPPGRPSSSQFVQIINGRQFRRSTLSWSLSVRPTRTGDFTIPPLRVAADGREYTTTELVLTVVKDMRGERLGYFEIVDPPTRIYEGQPFTIDLRMGWDLELPISRANLFLPWWGQLPGTLKLSQGPRNPAGNWLELTVNRRTKVQVQELAPITRAGREFAVLRLRRRYLASRPGTLELPASTFEFAQRGGQRDIFGNSNLERYYVDLPGIRIDVRPVPEAGRPLEWTGAVGALEASRRIDRRDVDVGDSIKLTVSWTGDGNLEFFDPPEPARLDAFAGFRVLGTEDEYRGEERRVTYDLVPVSPELTEIPPLPLWTFDPVLEAYRKIETEPVPIRVRALEGSEGLDDEEDRGGLALDIRDVKTRPAGPPLRRPGARWVAMALLGVPALWLLARILVRRRGDPAAPVERRRRAARRRLARDLKRSANAGEQTRALVRFLSARTRDPDQAWLGRSHAEWREGDEGRAVLDMEAAHEMDALRADLDESSYAGTDAAVDSGRILRTADRLLRGGL